MIWVPSYHSMVLMLNAYTISVNAYTDSYDINADFRRNAKVALFLELVEG
ncbi:hypothetical protein GCM10009409_14140 [Shewanella saliphila]|uniref:Uncharacterized protein n=1 Tax=Shewanella saliphila TaxID=2282698 RepID=A0ABQ2Q4S4_9GAMM|nr:hypothetical protein GCM10009409_14140 [Shewanella saliphila]